jgi:hypothetical protein
MARSTAAAPLPAGVQLARRVAGAKPPRCSGQTAVVVQQIEGVDPRLLLAELRPRRMLLIAPGFLPQRRDFPLRHALWHRAASIRRYNRRCHGRRRFDGRVWSAPDPSDPIVEIRLRRGRFLFLVVPPDAKVDAATVARQPQILAKQRIIGSGRSCGHREVLVSRLRATARQPWPMSGPRQSARIRRRARPLSAVENTAAERTLNGHQGIVQSAR